MLVNCNSCQKNFNVPDSAITEAGRLLQCGTCGNKWTQYPIKQASIKKEMPKIKPAILKQPPKVNKIKTSTQKKKRQISLYSEEYLKKKHGLEIKDLIDNNNSKKNYKKITTKNNFFTNLTVTVIIIIAFFGILNITKEFIIIKYPFAETYINSIYKAIEVIKVMISNLIN